MRIKGRRFRTVAEQGGVEIVGIKVNSDHWLLIRGGVRGGGVRAAAWHTPTETLPNGVLEITAAEGDTLRYVPPTPIDETLESVSLYVDFPFGALEKTAFNVAMWKCDVENPEDGLLYPTVEFCGQGGFVLFDERGTLAVVADVEPLTECVCPDFKRCERPEKVTHGGRGGSGRGQTRKDS